VNRGKCRKNRKKTKNGLILGNYAYLPLTGAMVLVKHFSVYQSKESMVTAATYVIPGMNLGPTLPDQDVPGPGDLPAEDFYAQVFRVAVAPVGGTAAAFFMCHKNPVLFLAVGRSR
jgi:hypothetical protein